MRRFPPYMIIAVCGILFLSAGMVIITADSTDPSAQPTATVDIPTSTPTEVVVIQPTVQPTDIPSPVPVQPVVLPTDVIPTAVIVPTEVVQPEQPTAIVEQQTQPTLVETQVLTEPTLVETQIVSQPTVVVGVPASPVPAGSSGSSGGVIITPGNQQPNTPLGTLPPVATFAPTAANPVVIATLALPTLQPTAQPMSTLAVITQVTGQVGAPLRADYAGILVVLTISNGSVLQTTTDPSGHFTFSNLAPGTYRLDASGTGYLSSQTTFSLSQGQSLVLPPTMLVGGDTNLDNKIDLTDAALIAANFDSSTIVPGADLNHDGIVDIRDLTAIGAYFGRLGPTSWQP